jgi:hypothetical protein
MSCLPSWDPRGGSGSSFVHGVSVAWDENGPWRSHGQVGDCPPVACARGSSISGRERPCEQDSPFSRPLCGICRRYLRDYPEWPRGVRRGRTGAGRRSRLTGAVLIDLPGPIKACAQCGKPHEHHDRGRGTGGGYRTSGHEGPGASGPGVRRWGSSRRSNPPHDAPRRRGPRDARDTRRTRANLEALCVSCHGRESAEKRRSTRSDHAAPDGAQASQIVLELRQ